MRACFRGIDALVLLPVIESAAHELSAVLVDDVWESVSAGSVPLRHRGLESCVEYRTRFSRTEYRSEESDSVVVSQARWLWRPDPFPAAWDVSVSFSVPDGVKVSLPWARSGDVYYPEPAAFALEVDLRIRELSDGKTTLLSAVRDAHAEQAHPLGSVRASQVLHALDESSGTELIERLGSRYADSVRFPDTAFATSAKYRETRAQITSLAEEACGLSAESSR